MVMSTVCKGVGSLVVAYGCYQYFRAKNKNDRMRAVSFIVFGIVTIAFGYVVMENNDVINSQDLLDIKSQQCNLEKIPDGKISCKEGVEILSTRLPRESTMKRLLEKLQTSMDFTSCRDFLPWKSSFYAPGTRSIERIQTSDMHRSKMWGFDPFGRFYFATTGYSNVFGVEAVAVHQSCPQNFEDFVSFGEPAGLDFSPV